MAEYKYRALGWKDDDIASLNVVGGTAADNQVELQITKQGAGGTIDGPAIVGKDGITINKAADSEKIEISGSGLVKTYPDVKPDVAAIYGYTATHGDQPTLIDCRVAPIPYKIPYRDENGNIPTNTPVGDTDCANKKYADDNFVKKVKPVSSYYQLYGTNTIGEYVFPVDNSSGQIGAIAKFWQSDLGTGEVEGHLLTRTPTKPYQCANKKYVDEADKDLRLKLSNLEQALNGYVLDTTKEAYADLDSAVLKNSVAVGDNVYPIADKTRALVTRIEGKTTKMVQMLDRSKFSATTTINGVTFTNNGNGSVTVTGTPVDSVWEKIYSISNLTELIKGHKYLLSGCPEGGEASTYMLRLNVYNPANHGWDDSGNGCIFIFDIESYDRNTGGIYIYERTVGTEINRTYTPQLFDLTAMNREDITTVEQFKAEFPEFYPYENGNIYPAKISGVKFTGKNLFDSNPNNLIFNTGNVEVVGNNIIITGYKENGRFTYKAIPLIIGETYTVSVSNYTKENSNALGLGISYDDTADITFGLITETNHTFTFKAERNQLFIKGYITYDAGDAKITISNLQVETGSQATPYEPYIEPVSVTLPETYDLHGIRDYKDYLEITKNEDNELYTLKKVQVIDKHVFDGTEAWTVSGRVLPICQAFYTEAVKCLFVYEGKGGLSNNLPLGMWDDDIEHIQFGQANAVIYVFLNKEKFTTNSDVQEYLAAQYASGNPLIAYYILPTPVETVIATNLTYEQVTAIRHNGGLIEVEGNTNKGYAKPTVTNTIVYRLTAKNTAEG